MKLIDRFREIFMSGEDAAEHEVATVEQAFAHAFETVDSDAHKIVVKIKGSPVFDQRLALSEFQHFIHQAEKEIEMVPQPIQDLITAIKNLLADHSAVQADNSAKDKQIADLTTASEAKDAQIADLTQKLADANGALADTQAALSALVPAPVATAPADTTQPPETTPAPAPADGSGSPDVQP